MKNPDLEPLKESLKKAESILITFPANADFGAVAAALALYLSLNASGKKVTVASSLQPTVSLANLVGINKVKQELEGKNLVISFDYVQDSIEKVSYNIENNNKFNLVVQAKEGFPPLDPGSITYSQSGASSSDLVLVLGASSLETLGNFYQENKEVFEKAELVNIDNQPGNSQFGKINLTDQGVPFCQLMIDLIKANNLVWNADVVGNLFWGLKQGTNNFTQKVTAATFEGAAWCLKQGAKVPTESRGSSTQGVGIEEKKKPQVPPDWLGPKIFQSSKRI